MSAKRLKMDESLEFYVKITQPQSFKSLVDILSNILTEVDFKIEKTDTFEGIAVDSIDSSQVCLVSARVACKVILNQTEDESQNTGVFCLILKTFASCLRAIPSHYFIDLSRRMGDTDVTMSGYEPTIKTSSSTFTMRTIAREKHECGLDSLDYRYTISLDLQLFRGIVKNCKDLNSHDLTIEIKEPRVNDDTLLKHTYVNIQSDSDEVSSKYAFHSITELSEGNIIVIKTAEERTNPSDQQSEIHDDLITIVNSRYDVNFLSLFMKSMDRQSLTMRLSPDKPLLLEYCLGGGSSYIRFVLAMKAD